MMDSAPANPKIGFRIKDAGSKGVAPIPPKIGGGGEKERRPEKHHKLALKVLRRSHPRSEGEERMRGDRKSTTNLLISAALFNPHSLLLCCKTHENRRKSINSVKKGEVHL